jgi:uncharacterized membrane protein
MAAAALRVREVVTGRESQGRREFVLLVVLLLLSATLRFVGLTAESLWYDETYSVWIAEMDIDSLRVLWEMPVQFPAYYVLLHWWGRLFGLGETSMRTIGALLGTVTVIPMYYLGKALFGREVGRVAALLLAINPYHVWYSQEVRMHSWAVLFTAVSLYAFWRLVNRGHWAWWLAHLFFTGLTFHLHYYIGFLIIAENVYVIGRVWREHGRLFSPGVWRDLRGWVLEQVALVAIMVPGIIVFLIKLLELREWDWLAERHGPPGIPEVLTLLSEYATGIDFAAPKAVMWAILALFGGLGVWGVVRWGRRAWASGRWDAPQMQGLLLTLLTLGLPLALMFIIGQFYSVWVTRYLLPFLPLFLLLVALGVAELPGRVTQVGALMIIVALSLIALGNTYSLQQKEDWRGVAFYLAQRVTSEDTIVLMDEETRVPFDYYYGTGSARVEISRFADAAALDEAVAELQRIHGGGEVWLVICHADGSALDRQLDRMPEFVRGGRKSFVGIDLYRYVAR